MGIDSYLSIFYDRVFKIINRYVLIIIIICFVYILNGYDVWKERFGFLYLNSI